MYITEDLKVEVGKAIQGVKFLTKLSESIKSELGKKIGKDKTEAIFNEEITIENLESNEQYTLLQILFNYVKDERFNPILIANNTNNDNNDTTDNKELSKDEQPDLYYDFDFKVKFTKTYKSKDTRRVIMALFRKTAEFEVVKAKNICNFNIEELTVFFKSLKSRTVRSLQNTVSTIERYNTFAQKHGKTEYKINYAKAFDSRDKLEDLLDKEAEDNMIFDKDEIMEMALNADNPQDGVIVGLLFDGVSHKNEFEELIELTKHDIDFDNKLIHLKDRTIPMSHETKMMVEDALDQERPYVSITGENFEKARKYKIAEGINILRGLRGKAKVKAQIVSQRLLRVAEIYDYPYLNATSISYSGQIHLAQELIENENLSLDDAVLKVLERFGIPVNDSSKFYLRTRLEKYLDLK